MHPETNSNISDLSECTRVAVVVDIDNLCNQGRGQARARVDLSKFARELRLRGARIGTACSHFFPQSEKQYWCGTGLKLKETHENADTWVAMAAADYVIADYNELILVAGDGDYAPFVRVARKAGVLVEVWSIRRKASRVLLAAADRHRFIDDMVIIDPSPKLPTTSNEHRFAA